MIKLNKDLYVCGQCGKHREYKDVVIATKDDVADMLRKKGVAETFITEFQTGFIGIRCKEHNNAEYLARLSVFRHLMSVYQKGSSH